MSKFESFIGSLGYLFVVLVGVLTIIEMVFFIKRNVLFIQRTKINFDNYPQYRKKFMIKHNVRMYLPYAIVSLLTIAVAMVCGKVEQTILYLIPLSLILLFNVLMITFNLMMTFYNKDLKVSDYYYRIVERSLNDRSQLSSKIKETDKAISELDVLAKNLESNLNALLKTQKHIEQFEKTKDALIKLRTEQEPLLESFDTGLAEKFNVALKSFLKTGANEFKDFSSAALSMDVNVQEIKKLAEDQQKLIFIENLRKAILEKNINSIESLFKMIDILNQTNATLTIEQKQSMLEWIDDIKENKKAIGQKLLQSRIVDHLDIIDAIDKKRYWLFENPISGFLTKENLTSFLTKVLTNDEYTIFEKYIGFANRHDFNRLQEALERLVIKNKTVDYARGCLKLLKHDAIFDDDGTKYEDMCLALESYYLAAKDQTKYVEIKKVIANSLFLENKDVITNEYFQAKKNIDEIYNDYIEVVTLYMTDKQIAIPFFSEEKVAAFITDCKKKLAINTLRVLCNTIIASMLVTYPKHNVNFFNKVNAIKTKSLAAFRSTPIDQSNAVVFGNEIFKKMITSSRALFNNVILRIEQERQLLDRFSKERGIKL